MLGCLPIRCGGPGGRQAPGVVFYFDSQKKLPRQVPGALQPRHT